MSVNARQLALREMALLNLKLPNVHIGISSKFLPNRFQTDSLPHICKNLLSRLHPTSKNYFHAVPVDARRKLGVHKTF